MRIAHVFIGAEFCLLVSALIKRIGITRIIHINMSKYHPFPTLNVVSDKMTHEKSTMENNFIRVVNSFCERVACVISRLKRQRQDSGDCSMNSFVTHVERVINITQVRFRISKLSFKFHCPIHFGITCTVFDLINGLFAYVILGKKTP